MLDASVPLNAGRPRPEPFNRTLGQLVALRGGQLENQQRQQQIAQTGQEMDERSQIKALLADPGDPETLFDRIDAISPTIGRAYRKSATDAEAANLELQIKKTNRLGQIAGSYKPGDQTSYHSMLAQAFGERLIDAQTAQQLLDVPPGPERDAKVQEFQTYTLTVQQQLEEKRKQAEDARRAAAQPALDAKAAADLEGVRLRNEALRNPNPSLQHVPLVSGGRTMLGAFNPATGAYQDQQGNPLPDARPIPTAAQTVPTPEPPPAVDPTSGAILAQTGLSQNAFLAATGQMSSLGRDTKTRTAATREWQNYAVKHGIDTSTFIPRFNAISKTIEANSLRNNQAEVAEAELAATLQNLSTAADEGSFKSMKWANVVKMFAGQQFNDPAVAKYRFHLKQLRAEFAMYNAALSGQIDANGNIRDVTAQDLADAESIIQDGFAQGGITGFSGALQSSMSKMKTVLEDSITRQNGRVWDLFGVGQNYKGGKTEPAKGGTTEKPADYVFVPGKGLVKK